MGLGSPAYESCDLESKPPCSCLLSTVVNDAPINKMKEKNDAQGFGSVLGKLQNDGSVADQNDAHFEAKTLRCSLHSQSSC